MTKKILKMASILVLLLIVSFSYVQATDINLNLPGLDNNTTIDDPLNQTTTNEQNQTNNDNLNQNMLNDQNQQNNNQNQNLPDTNTLANTMQDLYNDTSTLTPNPVNSASQEGLGTTDIINILLITVGVILVLLAIAIIIRLK